MTFPNNPSERSPKGDHNRRLSLGIDPAVFARQAGISESELRAYEATAPDYDFDLSVAEKVGSALELMEVVKPPLVTNGPKPKNESIGGNTELTVERETPSDRLDR